MSTSTRRDFVTQAAMIAGALCPPRLSRGVEILSPATKASDARIEHIACSYEEHVFRTPLKFALTVVNRATVLTVDCTVRTRAGKVVRGFGVMPLNVTFTFPSSAVSEDARLGAMKELAQELATTTAAYQEYGHPIEINADLAPLYLRAAADVSRRRQLAEPIPKLCTLVTAAAFDAAIHDAYGKAQGLNCFHTYHREFMNRDLGHYLGAAYRGEYPETYITREPRERMRLCHLVSAVDPIDAADNTRPIGDGLPETLREWIEYNGLKTFKIKLNGNDLRWDVDRVLHIDRVTSEVERKRRVDDWAYVLDFNEKCPDVGYYVTFLRQLQERMPDGFRRIEYVEQPTARDLQAHPENAMHEAARLCPVVIDESLTGVDALLLARRLGWTGAVVKSPKGLTHMLLVASAAGKQKVFLAGGDMSCPGAALIQTAGLQARVAGLTSVEANARQFLPAANKAWEARFPGMFHIKDGMIRTGELTRPGLGA